MRNNSEKNNEYLLETSGVGSLEFCGGKTPWFTWP
jgi:hypothetical protein